MAFNPDSRISVLVTLAVLLAVMLPFSANFVRDMIDFQPSFPVSGYQEVWRRQIKIRSGKGQFSVYQYSHLIQPLVQFSDRAKKPQNTPEIIFKPGFKNTPVSKIRTMESSFQIKGGGVEREEEGGKGTCSITTFL